MMSAWRSSEFPNDNSALGSATWLPTSVCGSPRFIVRARLQTCAEVEAETGLGLGADGRAERVQAGEAADSNAVPPVELATVAEPPPDAPCESIPAPDDFDHLVGAMAGVLLRRGQTRLAAELSGILRGEARSAALSQESLAALGGWRAVLSGSSADYSACGSRTLDEWAARLLSELTGSSELDLRRELRRAGVAAFGFLNAA